MESLEAITRSSSFERGVGLPGRVVESGQVAFVEDVRVDQSLPRAPHAAEAGLSAAVGLPLHAHGQTFGVIELTREARRADAELIE